MTTLFHKKPAPVLGIDIGASAIRLVELSCSGRSYRVEAYGCEPLAEDLVGDRTGKNTQPLAQAVARLVQRSRSRIRQAAVAVPAASVITKVIEVENLSAAIDLEHLVQLEAAPHIPYPLEEVALDFDVLGPSPDQADLLRVLLAASRREAVEMLDDLLQLAGLEAQVVDIETLVLERSLALISHQYDAASNKAIALVDISHKRMTLSVFRRQQIIYRREQPLAGVQPTGVMPQPTAGSDTGALQLAVDMEHEQLDQQLEISSVLPALIEVIQQNLQFFYATSLSGSLEGLLLAGDNPALPALVEPLAQATAMATALVDPVSRLDCAPAVNRYQLINDSSALLVACGLALRSFDDGHR